MGKKIIEEDSEELANQSISGTNDFPYVAIPAKQLTQASRHVNCDLFIERGEKKMTRVFSEQTGIDFKRLQQYLQKGIKYFYVRSEDMSLFNQFIKKGPLNILSEADSSQDEKIQALQDLTDQCVTEIYISLQISEDMMERGKILIKNFMKSLDSEPKLLANILMLAKHHDYLLFHSISVAIISMVIAKKAEKSGNSRLIEICGLGGLLHDIGETQIDPSLINAEIDLNSEQWKEMRRHPQLGARLLERAENIPDEVRHVVLQHHEEPGGNGYPNTLRSGKIYYPAKIVAIADSFAAMITDRGYRKAYTTEQAIRFMEQDVGKYDGKLIRVLKQIMLPKQNKKAA